jgi:hypothetical protein
MVVAEFPVHRGRELLRQRGFGGVNIQSLLENREKSGVRSQVQNPKASGYFPKHHQKPKGSGYRNTCS